MGGLSAGTDAAQMGDDPDLAALVGVDVVTIPVETGELGVGLAQLVAILVNGLPRCGVQGQELRRMVHSRRAAASTSGQGPQPADQRRHGAVCSAPPSTNTSTARHRDGDARAV